MSFSHIKNNKINMVDISLKKTTKRQAVASCSISFTKKSFYKLINDGSPKGEIFNISRCAGIMAAKKTSELIPLTHSINLSSIQIDFKINEEKYIIYVFSKVKTNFGTGVEIEAMTSCSIAAITIYDMCKSIDKSIKINDLKLNSKTGGKSGKYFND